MRNLLLGFTLALFAVTLSGAYNPSQSGPPGVIFAYAGTSCPAHSVAADGSSVLRAGQYANLFAVASTSFGTADGTHFNYPDLRGKFVRGVDGSASNDPDHGSRAVCNTGGATNNNVGSCQSFALEQHTHNVRVDGNYNGNGGFIAGTGDGTTGNQQQPWATTIVSGTVSTEDRPLNVYVLYCMWY